MSYATVNWQTRVVIVAATILGIIFYEKYRERNDKIGRSFQKSSESSHRIAISKNNQRHDRMAQNFDPSFRGYKREIRPKDRQQAVNEEKRQTAIVSVEFTQGDPSPLKDVEATDD